MSQHPPTDGASREIQATFPTAEGTVTLRLSVPSGNTRLSALVPVAQYMTQIQADASTRVEAAAGREASCRAGCAACCRQLIMLSIPEALHVADLVADAEPQQQESRRERFDAAQARLESEGLLEAVSAPEMNPSGGASPTAIRYHRLGIACPFLEQEMCSIHDRRPVTCRDYSVTTPAAWCADVFEGAEVRKIPMPEALTAALARATARLTGLPPTLIPLPLAPRWAAEHEELARQTWPGMSLVEALLGELTGGAG